ncbi:hypothetical protein BDV93DRAFT_529385, partial [Ceratobasidium sp. AG-I]
MSPNVLRLFFRLVPLVTLLAQQAVPVAALALQTRQSQGPTLPSNLTEDVLQVASAISAPCANTDSCISLVTDVIPKCEAQGGDPSCWCANHDALHYCAMCMISPADNQTTVNQTEAAAVGHSAFHVACDAYSEIVNGTATYLPSNDTLGPIDIDIWNTKNIRPDGTALIVHSNKDLVSGQAEKFALTWSFGPLVIRLQIVNIGGLAWRISGTIGINLPFFGYKQLASFSGILSVPKVGENKAKQVVISFNKWGVSGSVTFYWKDGALWVRVMVSAPFIHINKEFRIIALC